MVMMMMMMMIIIIIKLFIKEKYIKNGIKFRVCWTAHLCDN